MFYKLQSQVIFRNYESFGYLTDNRNFGYELTDSKDTNIGDKILSESGAVFLSVLSRTPQLLEDLAIKINEQFPEVDLESLQNDAREFYYLLEQDGFIISGHTEKECEANDTKFSYRAVEAEILYKDLPSSYLKPEKSTQNFFKEYFNGKPQLTNLHLEITSLCNERCLHCYIPHENKVSYIEPDLFYDILEQAKNLRLLHLTISGGEPMLHKNFCDFLRRCRDYNFSVNVLSNLTFLNAEIINEMKANPLLGVQVSLYAMDPLIHDEITQVKGSFEKTKEAILTLIENDIPLQISCPILKQNKHCYQAVINWAKKYKIHVGDDYVIIARYDHTTQNLSYRLSLEEVQEVIRYKAKSDPKYFEQLELEAQNKKCSLPDDFICSVCHSTIGITDQGNAYPCAGWQDYTIGNVKETSIKDIWDYSKKAHYLRALRKQDFPQCLECPDQGFCTMCLVRNANESHFGDPLMINEYYCQIAKLHRKIIQEASANSLNGTGTTTI